MHSALGDLKRSGFPIQKSQDLGSVTSSPGLIAGSHVFHRLWTPRHSPCALHGLITPTQPREPPPRSADSPLGSRLEVRQHRSASSHGIGPELSTTPSISFNLES